MRLALAFSVSFRTRPFDEVPKVMEESSNSSCLCSSSESSSMYQADRRPWLRVRMLPAGSLSGSLRLVRGGVVGAGGGGVTSSVACLLLRLRFVSACGDSLGGGVSSVVLGLPRRRGDDTPESDMAEEGPPSSPVDWLSSSSVSCLVLPFFFGEALGRARVRGGLSGLTGVSCRGLRGGSAPVLRLRLPTPRVT